MNLKILLPTALAFMVLAAFTLHQSASPRVKTCNTCDTLTGVEKLVCLADELKAALSAAQITSLQQDYNLTNAKKWSNLPVNLAQRIGIRFDNLNADQLAKAKALVQAAMGASPNEGYAEAQQLWAADKYLTQNGGGSNYGDGLYYLAFLGTPSTTGTWELQTGGHHFAVANTYSNGAMSGATPSFRGVEPFAAFTIDGNTYQPMAQERDSLAAILASFSTAELAAAKLSTTFNDIVLGPNKDWQFPTTKSGIKCSQLSSAQKNRVLAAIRTYVKDIDDENAAKFMALYTAQIDDTYIAYANTSGLSQQKDYIRIDGPRVWIEYSVQNGIVLTPLHPHSVWRDHLSDYGGLGNPSSSTSAAQRFEGKFDIFPNPATSAAQLQIELEHTATVTVNLFDSMGKKCSGGLQFNMASGTYTLPLQLHSLPQGSYNCVLEVKNADGSVAVATRHLTKM